MGQTTVYDYQNVLKITTLNRKMIYSGVSILMTTILSKAQLEIQRNKERLIFFLGERPTITSNFSELKYSKVLNCSNQNVFGQTKSHWRSYSHAHQHPYIHAQASKIQTASFQSFVFFPDARNFKAFLSYIKMVDVFFKRSD